MVELLFILLIQIIIYKYRMYYQAKKLPSELENSCSLVQPHKQHKSDVEQIPSLMIESGVVYCLVQVGEPWKHELKT